MDKLLVTGLSGFLGWHLSNEALKKYEVYGTVHKSIPVSDTIKQFNCELINKKEIENIFNIVSPDIVIHTAAISQPITCEKDPQHSYQINRDSSIFLASLCKEKDIPFIFTSSDMVFDGENAPYSEDSIKSPRNIYGKQKSEAEDQILKIYPEAAICRMPLMFGPPSFHSSSFIQPILSNLKKRIKSSYFYDEYRTPISAWDVSNFFLNYAGKFSGLLNLGGDEKISRFDFSLLVAKIGGYNKSLIESNSQKDVKLAAPRPRDLTMDNTKAKLIGFKPKTIEESLMIMKDLDFL